MERYLGGLERQFHQQNQVGSTNICTVLRLRGTVDAMRLAQATAQLSRTFPRLRASIVADPYLRFSLKDAPQSIPFQRQRMQNDEHWRRLLEKEMHRRYEPGQGLGVVHLLEGEKACDILFSVNHALADGLSSSYLCRALLQLYRGDTLPEAKASLPMEERFPARFRGLLGAFRALCFIFKLSKLGPALQIGAAPWTQTTLSCGFVFHGSKELNALARNHDVNLFSLVSALILQTIYELYGSGEPQSLSLNTPVSLRSGIAAADDELGLFIAGHLALYQLKPGMDVWELARQCHASLRSGVDKGHPYLLAKLARGARKPKPPKPSTHASQHRPTVSISNLGRVADFPALSEAHVYEHHALSAQSVKDPFAFVLISYQDRLYVDLQTSLEKMGAEAGAMILNHLQRKLNELVPTTVGAKIAQR